MLNNYTTKDSWNKITSKLRLHSTFTFATTYRARYNYNRLNRSGYAEFTQMHHSQVITITFCL